MFHVPYSLVWITPPLLRFTEVYNDPILAIKTKVVFNSPFSPIKGSTAGFGRRGVQKGEGFL